MADLVITLKGDAGDFKKQFDQAIASLNKFSNETKAGQGYIGSMESQLKLLKTQMRSASEQDLPALRTQFLNLKNAVREAQYGTESFTKKIGGEFDAALTRAGKKLFDLGNILKAGIGGFGVASIVSTFVEATGATKALDEAIRDVVQGIKDIGLTKLDIDLRGSVLPILEQAEKFIEAQKSADVSLLEKLQNEYDVLTQKIKDSDKAKRDFEKGVMAAESTGFGDKGIILSDEDERKINDNIALINNAIIKIRQLKSEKAGGGGSGGGGSVPILSPLEIALLNEPNAWKYNQSQIDVMNAAALPDLGSGFNMLESRINQRRDQDWIDEYFRKQEEAIDKLVQHEEQKRAAMMDRVGARIAQTFEDAVSAGMRGGFDEFLRNYMQQVGLKAFSGLLRLAFSSATGGSFGAGNLLGHIFGFAGGGEFYTHGAMPIIVGDNPGGIEKVTVEPISGRGTSGLKNGNLALAGGGTVMSAPMGQGTPEIIFRPIIKFDSYDVAYVLEAPNGGYEKLDKQRGRS